MAGPNKRRFDQIYRDGIRETGQFLRVHSLGGTGLIGVATARAIGNRPQRHKERRRVMSALRELGHADGLSLDLVISISPRAPKAAYVDLLHDLDELVRTTMQRWESV